MLQVSIIRQNPEVVKSRLAVKHFKELHLVDEIISLDDERKRLTFEFDETKAKINTASKEIGALMSKGERQKAEDRKRDVETSKNTLSPIQQALEEVEKKLHDMLVQLPNLPSEKVPPGKTPDDNEVVRTVGTIPQLPASAMPHWELAKKYDLIDF